MPSFRRHPGYGYAAATAFVAVAAGLKLAMPGMQPFLTLYPAVLLAAFVGGRAAGLAALAACTGLAIYFLATSGSGDATGIWAVAAIVGFIIVCGLILFVVDLLDKSIRRLERERLALQHERRRLELAFKAADMASWEIKPDGQLTWDDNFFRLVGLDPAKAAPATERFLIMVHPEDRARMQDARKRMKQGEPPPPRDEYRFYRPDGRMIWLENHRVAVDRDGKHFIGITQDVTRRKEAEKRITMLMRELAHRVKNQYAVILAMIRETNNQARSPEEFEILIRARITALSRSHDLLVHGEWERADLHGLIIAHLDSFGVRDRLTTEGPEVLLSPTAAQYLGMAFHELATNAAKHGAFSVPDGRVSVTWAWSGEAGARMLNLRWQENGGPAVKPEKSSGFGTKVLEQLAPAAVHGEAKVEPRASGLVWELRAPQSGLDGN
ncbi:MAG: sensor histidine kinase [Parvibaculaceae bacterium]